MVQAQFDRARRLTACVDVAVVAPASPAGPSGMAPPNGPHSETDCMAGVVGLEVRRETGKE
jgi:hypothetical protein